jgi:outer membrane protein assembly factor BamB
METPMSPPAVLREPRRRNGSARRTITVLAVASSFTAAALAASTAEPADAATVTVTGHVFQDLDGDGQRGHDEPGIAGVAVSDGETTVTTDAEGAYELEFDPDRRHTDVVFVSVPAGWQAPPDEHMLPTFFRHVDVTEEPTADFALVEDPASLDTDFGFATMADVHVGGSSHRPRHERRHLELNDFRANEGEDAMRFVAVTGDLTDNATDAEFGFYLDATAASDVPVWPGLGNHEFDTSAGPDYRDRVETYRRYVGPEWYSFSYGDRHFVMLDSMDGVDQPEQLEWLRDDLERHAQDRQVVAMFHAPLVTPRSWSLPEIWEYVELLESYDTRLLLAGHTHTNTIDHDVVDGAVHVITNSPRSTRDETPNGWRLVEFDGEELRVPFREFHVDRSLTLTHPSPDGLVTAGPTTIQANFYDATVRADRARFRIDDGNWHELSRTGARTWSADHDLSDLPLGDLDLTVEVTDRAGRTERETATFTLTAPGTLRATADGTPWAPRNADGDPTNATPDIVEPPLHLAWSHRTGGTILVSDPSIVDGMVYVGVRDEDDIAHAGVHAVDVGSGELRWHHRTRASVQASPAVADGRVHVSTIAGEFLAIDATTGDLLWRRTANGSDPDRDPAWSYQSPTVADGVVFQPYSTSGGLRVMAMDADTGEDVWWTEQTIGHRNSVWNAPTVAGDLVVVYDHGNNLIALDRTTGEQVWRRSVTANQRGEPIHVDGKLVIAERRDALGVYDASTGQRLWHYQEPGEAGGTLGTVAVSDDGIVYQGFNAGALKAFDLESGAELWSTPVDGGTSPPAVSGDVVYVGVADGYLAAFDRYTGERLWQYRTDAWMLSGPAVSGTMLVAAAWDGNLYAFTTEAGPCEPADPRTTVVIGTSDTRVPNRVDADGCTINDRIHDDQPWASRGAFVRHVNAVLDELHDEGVVDARERGVIVRAAATSGIGGPR